ncbi:MAG: oxaloacetate decarboxylase subunit alpha [Anaerovoracaceae bacterium]|jgi:oxaloacetate decarboxylase alpha subunit
MGKVGITETVLRDGHQSLIATRMKTAEMVPVLEAMDECGYHAIEMWGGATYDACLRFLDEDPWERLRVIRRKVKHTNLQMLLRGQNLLGYRHYADDVVDEFINRAIGNGIDIIRIFDALNDTRNLESSVNAVKKYGGHAQGCVSYTVSPVHTDDMFVKLGKELEEMGADSFCVKDMAGLLTPMRTYDLVRALKSELSIPVEIHTHATTGLGSMTYLKAVEAGADIIDTACTPFSGGSSQPPTEPMVAALRGTEYDTGIDADKLNAVAEYFRPLREKYIENGMMSTKVLGVDINTLKYQIPGGMLSNLISQLQVAGAVDRLDEVLEEIPRVREDFGYPPLVTPSSQIVGTQAVTNVITGERYKIVSKEAADLVKGMYGRTPVPVKEEVAEKILKGQERVTCRPADLLEPEMESARRACAVFMQQEEDALTQVMFPDTAKEFFRRRLEREYAIDFDLFDEENSVYPV